MWKLFQLYFLFYRDNRCTHSSSVWKLGYCPLLLNCLRFFVTKVPNISVLLSGRLPPGATSHHCLSVLTPYAAEQIQLISVTLTVCSPQAVSFLIYTLEHFQAGGREPYCVSSLIKSLITRPWEEMLALANPSHWARGSGPSQDSSWVIWGCRLSRHVFIHCCRA